MTQMAGKGKLKRVVMEATIIRADGTVEELGAVADTRRWFRWGPGRWLANRRIRKANENLRRAS